MSFIIAQVRLVELDLLDHEVNLDLMVHQDLLAKEESQDRLDQLVLMVK